MAIEWIISEGRPINPLSLIMDVEAAFARVTYATISLNLVEDSVPELEAAENGEGFSYILESNVDQSLRVELDQLSFDPSTGTCFGYVTSYRTKLSVALGIVAATCWHAVAGGDLSGTGLGSERLSVEQSRILLEELFRGATTEDRITCAAEKLGVGFFPYGD